MDIEDIKDNCTHCGRSTAFGSGLHAMRIPSITDTKEGWLCQECQQVECDSCGNLTLSYLVTESGLWVCENCGNDTDNTGFDTCDLNGSIMEPLEDSNWKGHYICNECDKVYNSIVEETMAKAKALGITGKALDDMQYWLTKMARDAESGELDMANDEEIDGLLRG